MGGVIDGDADVDALLPPLQNMQIAPSSEASEEALVRLADCP